MSNLNLTDDDISTEKEFNRALTELVRRARANDVDVHGGWSVEGTSNSHDYGIEIYRVTRPHASILLEGEFEEQFHAMKELMKAERGEEVSDDEVMDFLFDTFNDSPE